MTRKKEGVFTLSPGNPTVLTVGGCQDYVSGNLETVKQFIALAATKAHVEITTLIVPGKNDSAEEMDALASFLASVSPDIPLHLTRYFPRWHEKTPATPIETLKVLQETAGRHLNNVFLGNV